MRIPLLLGFLLWLSATGAAPHLTASGLESLDSPRTAQEGTASVSIDSATLLIGQTVAIAVTARTPSPGLGAFSVDVHFDASLVAVTNCAPAPGAQAVCNSALAPGVVRLAGNFTSGAIGSTTLGTITFAAGPNGGFTSLSLSADVLDDPEGHNIPAKVTNGTITVAIPTAIPTNTAVPLPTNTAVPLPTNTPVAPTATQPLPTNTRVRPTATQSLPTDTPVPPTATQPLPTNTPPPAPLPTNTPRKPPTPGEATKTPVPHATPTAPANTPVATPTAGIQNFILVIVWPPNPILAGNKVVIGVDLHMPELSVQADLGLRGNVAQVTGPGGQTFPIYFEGSSATFLTLHVDPGKNFSVEYSPNQEQEMHADTQEKRWDVGLTPEHQASGKQKVTLTFTQRLASNHPIPGTIRPQEFNYDMLIKGPDKSALGAIMEVAKSVPALITAIAGLITAVVGAVVLIRNKGRSKTQG